jgi:hypothetical protein
MSRYISFTKLKHLIFLNEGSTCISHHSQCNLVNLWAINSTCPKRNYMYRVTRLIHSHDRIVAIMLPPARNRCRTSCINDFLQKPLYTFISSPIWSLKNQIKDRVCPRPSSVAILHPPPPFASASAGLGVPPPPCSLRSTRSSAGGA